MPVCCEDSAPLVASFCVGTEVKVGAGTAFFVMRALIVGASLGTTSCTVDAPRGTKNQKTASAAATTKIKSKQPPPAKRASNFLLLISYLTFFIILEYINKLYSGSTLLARFFISSRIIL
jgi:hypothetical protein